MKIKLALACLALALAGAGPAKAQVYGQFTGAEPLPVNGRMFGAYIHSSKDVVGLLGQLRLSFYPSVDFGFQGGIARHDQGPANSDNRTTVRLGADFKVRVLAQGVQAPVAMSFGAAIGTETGDNFSILRVGPNVVVSHSAQVGESGMLTPYASAGLLYSRIDVDIINDTDVSMPLRFGVDALVAPYLRLQVEMQVNVSEDYGDDTGITAGVNIPF